MKLLGWSVDDKAQNDLLASLFESQQLAIEGYDTHKGALVTSEAFIVAWKEEEGIEVYYNDPRMCHVFYDTDNPKKKEFAAKWYKDTENKYHITLYYSDRLEYYETGKRKEIPDSSNAFKPSDPDRADNPYNTIPVFHYVLNRRSRVSELTNIVTLQDAVNKLFADMMVVAEYGAFRQRFVISNADTQTLKNSPNQIWQIPAGDGIGQQTQVGEFAGGGLEPYLDAIDKLANSIAIISRTPKHYFYASGADVSGEALLAMEAPLIAKVEQYQEVFAVAWKELGSFILLMEGKQIDPKDIELIWDAPQSVQPKTEAETMKALVETGIPLEIALRWAGKTVKEIEEIKAALKKAKVEAANQASIMLEKLRAESAQMNNNEPGQNNALQEADGGME